MASTNLMSKLLKKLSKTWFTKLEPEVVEQEELIQAWKYPEMEGYQGLAAFKELFYSSLKDAKATERERPIKKNTPAKAEVYSQEFLIYDYLYSSPFKGESSFLLQSYFKALYYGAEISSIQALSTHLNISKSSIGRLVKNLRERIA